MSRTFGVEPAHDDNRGQAGVDLAVSDNAFTDNSRKGFEDRAIGPFKTLSHAGVAILGLGGGVVFSVGLLLERFFDAALGIVFALLCWYIFVLLSDRHRLKNHLDSLSSAPALLASPTASASACMPTAVSDIDLTGCAKSLGVALGDGLAGDGDTLSKVLMSALAKEYLRCIAAIKYYESSYGKVQEDPMHSALMSGPAQFEVSYPEVCVGDGSWPQELATPQWANPVPFGFPSGSGDPSLALLVAGRDGEEPALSARTAASPRGPPSPESNRRQRSLTRQHSTFSEELPIGSQFSSPDRVKVQHERVALNPPQEQHFHSFSSSAAAQAAMAHSVQAQSLQAHTALQ